MGGAGGEGNPWGRGRGLLDPRLSATRTGETHSKESLVYRTPPALGTGKVFLFVELQGLG